MDLPKVVDREEVRRVCAELGLRDWTQPLSPSVTPEEAESVQKLVGGEALEVPVEAFKRGLEVELEHGFGFPDSNITNNHPVLTGMIVLAHLKESLLYYGRLDVAELEGDLARAIQAMDAPKAAQIHKRLLAARMTLIKGELDSYAGG